MYCPVKAWYDPTRTLLLPQTVNFLRLRKQQRDSRLYSGSLVPKVAQKFESAICCGHFLCRRVYAARIAHVLALTEYAVLKQQQDGLLVPSRSWLHLHPAPLLRLFDVNSYPLVKLLSLLSEPLVAVLSVYGELEPARPVLVGFELRMTSFARNV